ncbi:transcription-repair coupling factor [Rhodohalobacter barkolensis]|uniref:Transcription-repair-coupling factor n=1 Tax=Rhodohalobacter barkolensis TaxID=2053187 RepID=A0A2N0VKM0_9BACT|nr:transcription-repair coupling factor [Rhodohalobacter barkolensis]PKD44745.1 transcription-repair coupling factor [Rhodohalobacter barkolensis]
MINQIRSAVLSSIPVKEVIDKLSDRKRVLFKNFIGSSPLFSITEIQPETGTLLYITKDFERSAAIAADIEQISEINAYLFPPTRRKPYDSEKVVDMSVLVQRSEVLEKISSGEKGIIVASIDALVEKLVPADVFHESSIKLVKGNEISPDDLSQQLVDQGYTSTRFVDAPGEFAIRGGIFDVYPFSGEYPVRIEFFGDEIETIREFDPNSQRSIAFLNETRLVPNAGGNGMDTKESLLSYLPENSSIVVEDLDVLSGEVSDYFEKAEKIYSELDEDKYSAPELNFVTPDEWNTDISKRGMLLIGNFNKSVQHNLTVELDASPHPSFSGNFKLLREFITEQSSRGVQTYILADHENQKERFEELLGEPSDNFLYHVSTQTIHEGFILNSEKKAVLTDHQIFNRYHRPKIKRKRVRGGISFKELKDLNIGDFVVHVDYGIGKFAGFKKIEVRNTTQEAAVLRYKDDSTLYVNVSSLHKIQKYSGKEGKQPRVTKLGSGEWARKKATTKKKVKDIARDLIELYAKRKAQKAFAFNPDNSWQTEMEARFEYEETPDQLEAIHSVKADMESEQPMDRLICGDVGFGKTEIAVRAAFKSVMDQKQVAVLVPTTILADQHYKTFADRMKEFPIEIESLSRFRTAKEQKEIIKKLEAGKVDILIGTHRIVSKDVKFKNLGLLVIDEEQRFGVSVKEKLKEFRATVDVMTLTATPIPRTLQFSLMGARDLSIINTPPPNRQPVYTEIHSFSEELIRDAIIEETSRGGQVFIIHNRVKNIEQVAGMIHDLVPDIRVRFAHGQMKPSRLEKIIKDFYEHRFDVLISTNIVENGIDIANANTIIINNANQFGLSELHQLRGRVGRSNRKAFCYLITPPIQKLSPDARKRLTALEEFSDLGSGFNIAMRDLDIRGAGDILGAEQSGFISDVGFELYSKILDDAVKELKETEYKSMFKNEEVSIDYPETQVEFDLSAYLDKSYVKDNVERLNLYRKLSEASSIEQIEDWQEEVIDRFGKMNKTGNNLVEAAKIKLIASKMLLKKVTIRADRMWLMGPKNDSKLGEQFYGSGFFQKLLGNIQSNQSHPYKVVQKNDTVTLVIQNIKDEEQAIEYLNSLPEFTVDKQKIEA